MANLFKPLFPLVLGIVLGVVSWLAAWLGSGHFEPYDSSLGLLINQLIVALPALYFGLARRPGGLFLLVLGAWLGMNGYHYLFGGAEARAWAGLGAAMSLLLLAVPTLIGVGGLAIRRWMQPRTKSSEEK